MSRLLISTCFSGILGLTGLLTLSLQAAVADNSTETVVAITDLHQLGKKMLDQQLPLMLVFEAEYCTYCKRLRAEHLNPMQQNASYAKRVIIRSADIDLTDEILDFNAAKTTAAALSHRYKARLTPTIVFLNAHGEEVAQRIRGYTTPDYYGYYLDKAIDEALHAVQSKASETDE